MTNTAQKIACIGECMVEIAVLKDQRSMAQVGFGGDTLNTAIYLSRLVEDSKTNVYFSTLLGDDSFSYQMSETWQKEGISTDLVEHLEGREAGLYAISVDHVGERSFNYWRTHAPVREIFEGNTGLSRLDQLSHMDTIFFSGITLAVLFEESCNRLLDFCQEMKNQDKSVIFDSNYRSRLWHGRNPRHLYDRAFKACTLALPSYEDLERIFGLTKELRKDQLEKYKIPEIVLKNGGGSLDLYQSEIWQSFELDQISHPIDTTAAGDSFNAGYIHARLSEISPPEAIKQAHKLASHVINFPGAIIPKSEMPKKD